MATLETTGDWNQALITSGARCVMPYGVPPKLSSITVRGQAWPIGFLKFGEPVIPGQIQPPRYLEKAIRREFRRPGWTGFLWWELVYDNQESYEAEYGPGDTIYNSLRNIQTQYVRSGGIITSVNGTVGEISFPNPNQANPFWYIKITGPNGISDSSEGPFYFDDGPTPGTVTYTEVYSSKVTWAAAMAAAEAWLQSNGEAAMSAAKTYLTSGGSEPPVFYGSRNMLGHTGNGFYTRESAIKNIETMGSRPYSEGIPLGIVSYLWIYRWRFSSCSTNYGKLDWVEILVNNSGGTVTQDNKSWTQTINQAAECELGGTLLLGSPEDQQFDNPANWSPWSPTKSCPGLVPRTLSLYNVSLVSYKSDYASSGLAPYQSLTSGTSPYST